MNKNKGTTQSLKKMVLDEIALEGLEGITLPTLWKYMCRNYKCADLPASLKYKTWAFILSSHQNLNFFTLPFGKDTINIWDRYINLDPVYGIPVVNEEKDDIRFKFSLVDEDEVLGSCSNYKERKPLDYTDLKDLSLNEVMERWGTKLVIVASQNLRWISLVSSSTIKPDDLTPLQYAILEAIGRSRFNGETTCGPWSLLQFCDDSSVLFYVRNKLFNLNLILQQPYHEKQGDRITPCCLVALPRFFIPFKSHLMIVIQNLVKEIRTTPDFQITVGEIRNLLSQEHNKYFKKISALPIFRQFFDVQAPTEEQKKCKTEKQTLLVNLRNPEVETTEVYQLEDVDDEDNEIEWDEHFNKNTSVHIDMPTKELFINCITTFGVQGCSHAEICQLLSLPHLTVRMIEKSLREEGIIKTYTIDIGRQRMNMYVTVNNDEEAQRLKEESAQIQYIRCKEEPNIPIVTDQLMSDVEFIHGIIKYHTYDVESLSRDDVYTHRLIKRKTLVIKAIDEECIVQVPDLRVFIQKQEKESGYSDELCQKSMWRLLYNMHQNNLVQLYDIFLKYDNVIRTYRYVTHPKIEIGDAVLKHEMIKLKNALYLILEEKKTNPTKNQANDFISISNMNSKDNKMENPMDKPNMNKKEIPKRKESIESENDDQKTCAEKRKLLIKPIKFPKLLISRHLHELLHYLVYELELDRKECRITEDLLYQWQRSEPDLQVKSYFEELKCDDNPPVIYRKDINWRTFIPPLPIYKDKPKGWLYFLDVMKRIPLSLLNKIFRIEKDANEEVLQFLMHPVKQHYMLRQVPNTLQGIIVTRLEMQKTYVMCLKLLQKMGLLQISIKATVRDPLVIWLYVNRYAKVVDTTTSDAGYDVISTDRKYSENRFDFQKSDEVIRYWNELHRVCVYTKLGFKKNRKNRTMVEKKKDVYLQAVDFNDAPNLDRGEIPGNGLGAGGLCSKLFAHALRHWSWIIQSDIQTTKQVRPARIPVVRSKPKISLNARRSRSFMPSTTQRKKQHIITSNKNGIFGSHQTAAKKSGPRDAIDRDALNNMRSLRVKWSKKEDEMIKIARAVYLYIAAPVPALGLLTVGKVVRDLLRHNLNIKNKTQQACVRRSQFLIKMHRDIPEVPSWLHTLQTNPFLQYKYGEDFLKRLKAIYPIRKEYCDALTIHFILISKLLYSIVYENNHPVFDCRRLPKFAIPDTISEYTQRFRERLPVTEEPLVHHKNPESEHDQHVSVVHGVLHSTLCCARDKTLYNLQAFDIYKNYSEEVLQAAFTKARNDSLAIAVKRKNLQLSPTQLAGPAYLLSNKYRMRLIFLKLPYAVYDLFYTFFSKCIKDFFGPRSSRSKDYFELKSPQIGQLILIAEGLCRDFLIPFVKFPINILTLDAEYKEKCSHMDRIMDHYSSIFANAPTTDYYKSFEADINDGKSLVKFHPAFLTYNVKHSPFDIVSKLSSYRLHFFCALNNLHKTVIIDVSKLQSTDDETKQTIITCPFQNCIMKSINYHHYINIIDRIVHNKRSDLDKLMKESNSQKDFILTSEPKAVIITNYNLLALVTALENHWQKILEFLNKRDFGKLPGTVGKWCRNIKWLELCQDILNFKKNDEKDFCDDYEPKLNKEEKAMRAQDIFVVNLPTLQFKINSKCYDINKETVQFQGVEVPDNLVESEILRPMILGKIQQECLWKYTENTIETLKTEESYLSLCCGEQDLLIRIHDMIENKKIGVTSTELIKTFNNFEVASKILDILSNHYLVKRVGVASFMYVHKNYVRPWVIHTFHIKRLEKEKMGSTKRRADEISNDLEFEQDEEENLAEKKLKIDEHHFPQLGKRLRKPVNFFQNNFSKCQKKNQQRDTIVMKPRPWLRLNGSLNRRVLDRWLGSLLTECVAKTSCSLIDLSQRFPQVLPVDIYFLIELLSDLKCVRLVQIISDDVDLFSSYTSIKEINVTEVYDPINTFVVTKADALSRMAIFIGQKKYDAEFI